jgi:hypothetical protein
MPKIPTFITEARPTAEVGGVISGIQVPVTAPFTGVQSALTDYYIQEKKKEAAVKTLDYKNQYWNDSEDGTQGLFSIKNKHENNPNTTDAINGMKSDGKNYETYLNNKLQGESDYLKQSVLAEFKADLNRISLTVQEKSQDALDKKQGMIAENVVSTELAVLGDNPALLPTSKIKLEKALEDLFPNNQIKKQQYLEKGYSQFDQFVAQRGNEKNVNISLSNLKDKNIYPNLNADVRMQLITQAEKKVETNLFNQITIGLEYTPDSTMKKAGQEFNKIIDGRFDDPTVQNAYNSLSADQKIKLKENAIKKYNEFETIFKVRADDSKRLQADGSKKAVDNLTKKANSGLYDPNLIKESFKGNEKLINDFSKINILSSKNELLDSSAYPVKYEIMKNISSGNVIDVETPFRLTGESTPMSLTDRVINKQISKSDLENFNTQFKIEKIDDKTKNNMTKFFDFVKANELLIGGSPGVREIDSSYDKRMNLFIDEMYSRYNFGISQGIPADSLLNRNDSKNFIAKDAANYQLSRSQLDKEIDMQIRKFQDAKLYKVGEVITNSKGEKAVVVRIDENGKVILNRQ